MGWCYRVAGTWKPIFAFSFCISFGFVESDWWVVLSGVSARGLNQHLLALSWKWFHCQRMPAGQGADNLSSQIAGIDLFPLGVFEWVLLAALVSEIPLQKAQQNQAQAWTLLPADPLTVPPLDPENPKLSSLCCSGSPQKGFRAEQGSDRLGQNVTGPYKSIDEAALALSLLSLLTFGFCPLCWLMLLQQSRVAKADRKVSQLTDKKGKK